MRVDDPFRAVPGRRDRTNKFADIDKLRIRSPTSPPPTSSSTSSRNPQPEARPTLVALPTYRAASSSVASRSAAPCRRAVQSGDAARRECIRIKTFGTSGAARKSRALNVPRIAVAFAHSLLALIAYCFATTIVQRQVRHLRRSRFLYLRAKSSRSRFPMAQARKWSEVDRFLCPPPRTCAIRAQDKVFRVSKHEADQRRRSPEGA